MTSHAPEASSKRSTQQGDIIGFSFDDATHAWWGIPFAAPPTGELRWRAPRPPAAWPGVRECVKFGDMATQLKSFMTASPPEQWNKAAGSEDCLTLNIFAPKKAAEKPLPVMVWVHGGGNTGGASSMYSIAGNLPAHGDVVVISLNYRLGVFGWFYHPALFDENCTAEDKSGNYGTLDIIHALRWVKENISNFGGDANNVTLFGESAGGQNVLSLYVSPLAKGLFHKAIAQSPISLSVSHAEGFHFHDDPQEGARGNSADVFAKLLIADGKAKNKEDAVKQIKQLTATEIRTYLYRKSAAEIITVFNGGSAGIYESPRLFQDGTVLPDIPVFDAFSNPNLTGDVPLIIGSNRDELKLFMALNPAYVRIAFGKVPIMRNVKRYQLDADYFSNFWRAAGVDEPMAQLYQSGNKNIFMYRFDWDEIPLIPVIRPDILIGAAHATEISFVFRDLAGKFNIMRTFNKKNEKSRIDVAKTMSQYWINFAHNSNPNSEKKSADLPEWKSWQPSHNTFQAKNTLIFDSEKEGGIRMTSTDSSFAAIKKQLKTDKRLLKNAKERCRLYAQMFLFPGIAHAAGSKQEYELFGDNGCAPVPATHFKNKGLV